MMCHVLSCFPCRRSCAAGVPGMAPPVPARLPGFVSGVFRLRFPRVREDMSGHGVSPFRSRSVPSARRRRDPNSRVMRACARALGRAFRAGAVCAPDCPGAPPRASRTQGGLLPSHKADFSRRVLRGFQKSAPPGRATPGKRLRSPPPWGSSYHNPPDVKPVSGTKLKNIGNRSCLRSGKGRPPAPLPITPGPIPSWPDSFHCCPVQPLGEAAWGSEGAAPVVLQSLIPSSGVSRVSRDGPFDTLRMSVSAGRRRAQKPALQGWRTPDTSGYEICEAGRTPIRGPSTTA